MYFKNIFIFLGGYEKIKNFLIGTVWKIFLPFRGPPSRSGLYLNVNPRVRKVNATCKEHSPKIL